MKIRKYVIVIFGLCCIMTSGINAKAIDKDKVVLWASNPLDKIFQDSPIPKKVNTKGVFIEALRNEYEPAQVCITSTGYQGPVRIKVNPLVHLSGKYKISNINARFVGYIPTPPLVDGSNRFPFFDSPAAYPDPLIWDEEVTLKPHQTQPVWITVKVPKDALPGEYKGNIEVITKTGNVVLPLNLTVYPVTLPETSNFSMGSWGGDTKLAELFGVVPAGKWQKGDFTPEYLDFVKNVSMKNRYEHRERVFTDQPFWPSMKLTKVTWKDGGYVYDYTLLDKLISTVKEGFHNQFKIICLAIANEKNKGKKGLLTGSITVLNSDGSVNPEKSFSDISTDDPRYRAFIGDFFKAMSLHLQEKGWLDKVYFKVTDEPGDKFVASDLRLNAYIKQTAPKIRLDATFWKPGKTVELMSKAGSIDLSIVNAWTMGVKPTYWQTVQKEIKKGREFLLYNDPNIVIDKPLIDTRKVGWLCSFYGVKGYMHWAYCWRSNPWKTPFDVNYGFGAHYLVYPDMARKKIVDSIRWEMLRETAEDYDTLYLLKKAGGNSRKFVQQVKDLSGTKWDPKKFYQIRHQLLLELTRLSK